MTWVEFTYELLGALSGKSTVLSPTCRFVGFQVIANITGLRILLMLRFELMVPRIGHQIYTLTYVPKEPCIHAQRTIIKT